MHPTTCIEGGEYQMRKGNKGMTVLGVIVILAIIVSVFCGVVSAGDASRGLKQNVDDAEIQTAVGNVSSDELAEALYAVTDDTVNIEFADQSAPLGPYVSSPNLGEQAASLAEAVVGAPYLWGGKGYEWNPTITQAQAP
jgi:hypothetical protein